MFSRDYVEGRVLCENLGHPRRLFKIVRLLGGERLIVDQDIEVKDPLRIVFNRAAYWSYAVQRPKHFSLLSVAT